MPILQGLRWLNLHLLYGAALNIFSPVSHLCIFFLCVKCFLKSFFHFFEGGRSCGSIFFLNYV